MKNNFAILAVSVLCSFSAFGISLDDAILSLTGEIPQSITLSGVENSASVSVSLNVPVLRSYFEMGQPAEIHHLLGIIGRFDGGGSNEIGLCNSFSSEDGLIVTSKLHGFTADSNDYELLGLRMEGRVFRWDKVAAASLSLMKADMASCSACLSLRMKNGNNSESYALSTLMRWDEKLSSDTLVLDNALVSSAYVFNSVLSHNEAHSINTSLIEAQLPEPNLFCFVLSALAAISLRRRRKH